MSPTIISLLLKHGIDTLFTYPGASIDPFFEFIVSKEHNIRVVVAADEAGAAYMADGWSRATGRIGVILVSGGVGLANLMAEVYVSLKEGVPLLLLSGDIPTHLQHKNAFQSGDYDIKLARALTKYSARMTSVAQMDAALTECLSIAQEPPMGPVHLSIPYDVWRQPAPPSLLELAPKKQANAPVPKLTEKHKKQLLQVLNQIQHPGKWILMAGEQLGYQSNPNDIASFAAYSGLPLLCTFGAKSLIPEHHPNYLGNAGYGGRKAANELFLCDEVEGVLWVGAEINERNTMAYHKTVLSPTRKNIFIGCMPPPVLDISQTPISHISACPRAAVAFLRNTLTKQTEHKPSSEWLLRWQVQKSDYDLPEVCEQAGRMEPSALISIINSLLPPGASWVTDSGQHRIFAGMFGRIPERGLFLTSPVMAPTGWGIGAGIGARMARPDYPVVVLTGDGCMRMNGFEIQTAVREKTGVVFVIFNNQGLGSIMNRFNRKGLNASSYFVEYNNDWVGFARSLGADAFRAQSLGQFSEILHSALQRPNSPTVIEAPTLFPPHNPAPHLSTSAYA